MTPCPVATLTTHTQHRVGQTERGRLKMFLALGVTPLLLLLLPLPARTSGGTAGAMWSRLPGNSVSINVSQPYEVLYDVSSAGQCWARGKQRPNCTSFCYDVQMSMCYVGGITTAPEEPVTPADINLHCYGLCPPGQGYAVYVGRCLRLVNGSMTHAAGQAACREDGAHLLHYRARMLDFLALNAITLQHGANLLESSVWVGADDLITEGQFTWSDDYPLSPGVWNEGEPRVLPQEDCVVHLSTAVTYLGVTSCDIQALVVCQIDM